jgi:hypothetical protein
MIQLDTAYLAFIIILFIILSPGLILTIPGLSDGGITNMGVAFGSGPAVACPDATPPVEANCKKPTQILASGYTHILAIFIHAAVFAVILYFLPMWLGLGRLDINAILVLTALFVLLSPGLLLTLPPLSKNQCGEGNQNVAESTGTEIGNYCDAITTITSSNTPNCAKCTSWWTSNQTGFVPILVHALVFGILAYYIALTFL